jgi:hypothetical protein
VGRHCACRCTASQAPSTLALELRASAAEARLRDAELRQVIVDRRTELLGQLARLRDQLDEMRRATGSRSHSAQRRQALGWSRLEEEAPVWRSRQREPRPPCARPSGVPGGRARGWACGAGGARRSGRVPVSPRGAVGSTGGRGAGPAPAGRRGSPPSLTGCIVGRGNSEGVVPCLCGTKHSAGPARRVRGGGAGG